MTVRLGDGVEIELATGDRFVADASSPDGDVNFVSHAHGDHLFGTAPGSILCSALTAELAAVRRDVDPPETVRAWPLDPADPSGRDASPTRTPEVDLLPTGHVPGSRAALVDDGETRYLYTGDVATRDRFFLDGFEPVDADVLIVESTYGTPAYEFPPQDVLERRIETWLDETRESPLLLFGYPLGRAQAIQLLAARADRRELYVTDAIHRLNAVIERHCDVAFDAAPFADHHELEAGDVLVLPSRTAHAGYASELADRFGAIRAGFSGWAVDEGYRYRTGLDVAFPLSDHCDYRELLALVEAVDPEIVSTHHGFADELATNVRSELGVPAQALKRNQSTLGDF